VAIQFSISGSKDLTLMMEFLQNQTYDRAVRDGLSYAGRAGKTTFAKEIGQRYTLAAARIKQDISNPSINSTRAEMSIRFSRKPPSALSYGGRDTGRGLTMAIFRGERVKINRGFVVRSGRLAGKPFKRKTEARKPIYFVQGPSIGSIALGEGKFSEDIQTSGLSRIQEQYLKGVDRSLRNAARRK
jgi:hypothetical protein